MELSALPLWSVSASSVRRLCSSTTMSSLTGISTTWLFGDGDKLEGRTVAIYSLVTDIRRDADDMAVTWILVGGGHRLSATATGTPAKKFGSQMFKGIFHFISS